VIRIEPCKSASLGDGIGKSDLGKRLLFWVEGRKGIIREKDDPEGEAGLERFAMGSPTKSRRSE